MVRDNLIQTYNTLSRVQQIELKAFWIEKTRLSHSSFYKHFRRPSEKDIEIVEEFLKTINGAAAIKTVIKTMTGSMIKAYEEYAYKNGLMSELGSLRYEKYKRSEEKRKKIKAQLDEEARIAKQQKEENEIKALRAELGYSAKNETKSLSTPPPPKTVKSPRVVKLKKYKVFKIQKTVFKSWEGVEEEKAYKDKISTLERETGSLGSWIAFLVTLLILSWGLFALMFLK